MVHVCACVFIHLCVGDMSLLISFILGAILSYRHKQHSLTGCKPLSKQKQIQSYSPEGNRLRGRKTEGEREIWGSEEEPGPKKKRGREGKERKERKTERAKEENIKIRKSISAERAASL